MSTKVILICGKICCGKSTYAKQLQKKERAVVLSCDEIMLSLFDEYLGNDHERMSQATQHYLFKKSLEFLEIGVSVILDWGFWTAESRNEARAYYRLHDVQCETHYIDVADSLWFRLIAERNEKTDKNKPQNYRIDHALQQKCLNLFEEPSPEEIILTLKNHQYDPSFSEHVVPIANQSDTSRDACSFDADQFLKDHENDVVAFVHGLWKYHTGEGSYTCRLYYQNKSKTIHKDLTSLKSNTLAMIYGAKAVCESIKRDNMTVYIITPTELGFRKALRGEGVNKDYIQEVFEICRAKSLDFRPIALRNGGQLIQNIVYKI